MYPTTALALACAVNIPDGYTPTHVNVYLAQDNGISPLTI
eukprot:SAG11_NODE_40457_length_201_cov_11.313725_1_plen_39_part_01